MPVLPKKLNIGDTIGIISPAGAVKETAMIDSAVKYFERKGYKVKLAPHICDKNFYLAGNDENRLADLTNFFLDDEIKAILCSRGGYGTYRFLDKIDWELIRNNPKIFVGYSDITALLNNFVEKANLVCFHGPLALSDFGVEKINSYTERDFWEVLEGNEKKRFESTINYECIVKGQSEGVLMGGNLSILCGLLGTPYFPNLTNKILLLEDIAEPLYKIDRMLAQLKLAGVLDKTSGILFADFTSVPESNHNLTPLEVAKEFMAGLNVPVGYGFPASHAEAKATLPLGVKYFFDSENFELKIIENYII